jgi:glucokinase
LAIGVDLGGTSLRAAAVDEKGRVLGRGDAKTRPQEGRKAVFERLVQVIEEACAEADAKVGGVGIGVPGAVNAATGEVHFAPNLDWRNVPLGPELSQRVGAPVVLDNDVNVAVLGEQRFGAARGRDHVVGVWVGTGIGGGLVVDGKLVRGARGSAGELGHSVLIPDGPQCGCGARGCVEALASRSAMDREIMRRLGRGETSVVPEIMERSGKARITSGVLKKALAAGDEVVQDVLAKTQGYLALAIATWLNVLDSEVVVIGGGVAEKLGKTYVAPIAEAAERLRFPTGGEPTEYVVAELGDDSGILGAAGLVL